MNVYTLAARETVREIRESLSRQEPTLETLRRQADEALHNASHNRHWNNDDSDYEYIELWARLAADLASMIQQRQKEKVYGL